MKKDVNSIKIVEHIPIVFSEIAGRTLYRVEHKDIGRESEQQALTNVLPLWIVDTLTNVCFLKFCFFFCLFLT